MSNRFKRILSAFCAAAVITASGVCTSVPAAAQTTQSYSYCRVQDFFSGETVNLYDYIYSRVEGYKTGTKIFLPSIKTEDGKLGTLIDADVLRLIESMQLTVEFDITDDYYNISYNVELSSDMISSLGGQIPEAGINIALRLIYDASSDRIYAFSGQPSADIGLLYKIPPQTWNYIINSVEMELGKGILCFSNDEAGTFIKPMQTGSSATFVMQGQGVFFAEKNDYVYYASAEASDIIREEFTKVINGGEAFTEKQLKKLDETLSEYIDETTEYIRNTISGKTGSNYYGKEQIEKAVAGYFSDALHRREYISVLLGTGNASDRIEGILLEYFGFDTSAANIKLMRTYIKDLITENAVSTVNGTNIAAEEIPALIEHFFDEWVRSQTVQLQTEMNKLGSSLSIKEKMDIITGQGSVTQTTLPAYSSYYNTAETMPLITSGTQTTAAAGSQAGQGFIDWVNQNYGDIETFIDMLASYAASKVPAGRSAYDIAVDNGFVGTEKEWLDSLKGKDGGLMYVSGSNNSSLFYSSASLENDDEEITLYDDPDSGMGQAVPLPAADDITIADGSENEEDVQLAEIENIQSSAVNEVNEPEDGSDAGELVFPTTGDTSLPTSDGSQKTGTEVPQTGNITIITPSSDKGSPSAGTKKNPGTGVAAGIAIPAAAALSVFLVRKNKRRRTRRRIDL